VGLSIGADKIAVMEFIGLVFSQDLEQTLLLLVSHALSCASEAEFHDLVSLHRILEPLLWPTHIQPLLKHRPTELQLAAFPANSGSSVNLESSSGVVA
jgi:hypothetical protein